MRDVLRFGGLRRLTSAVAAAVLLTVGSASGAGAATTPPRDSPDEDVRSAVATVDAYWRRGFEAADRRYRPVSRVYSYDPSDGSSHCGPYRDVPRNARYCTVQNDIAFDGAWMTREYERIGDAFVYYVIGHEYAHAIQEQLGVTHQFNIQQELQADCLSGASLGGAVRAGELRLEPGDIDELRKGLREVGDPQNVPWFDPNAHGSPAQRDTWFARGFDGGSSTC
jgi:predicted metalloprotease